MKIEDWIGRTESRSDIVTAAPMAALSATLDRNDPPPRIGDPLPILWHWLYFLPTHRQSELDVDGHARLGGFLPPVPLPRRLYAGGRIEQRRALRVGDEIARRSEIVDISQKQGRSGQLVFVKARHEISSRAGLALIEDHDIVYRDRVEAADARRAGSPAVGDGLQTVPMRETVPATWSREIRPDDVLLFRYSALTFNGYRIHYDRRFATEEQGYPGLVVHAPLVATLLADLVRRHLPDESVSSFSFRAIKPLFDTSPFQICGRDGDAGGVRLWAQTMEGAVAFTAEATLGSG